MIHSVISVIGIASAAVATVTLLLVGLKIFSCFSNPSGDIEGEKNWAAVWYNWGAGLGVWIPFATAIACVPRVLQVITLEFLALCVQTIVMYFLKKMMTNRHGQLLRGDVYAGVELGSYHILIGLLLALCFAR